MLLAKGADVNLRDKDDFTALIHVVRSGSLKATRALLDAGAKLRADEVMPDGSPPAQWVTKNIGPEDKEDATIGQTRLYALVSVYAS